MSVKGVPPTGAEGRPRSSTSEAESCQEKGWHAENSISAKNECERSPQKRGGRSTSYPVNLRTAVSEGGKNKA